MMTGSAVAAAEIGNLNVLKYAGIHGRLNYLVRFKKPQCCPQALEVEILTESAELAKTSHQALSLTHSFPSLPSHSRNGIKISFTMFSGSDLVT